MTDVRRERIPWRWSTVGETALAEGFCCNMTDTKYPCVCRRTKLPGRRHTVRRSEKLAEDE